MMGHKIQAVFRLILLSVAFTGLISCEKDPVVDDKDVFTDARDNSKYKFVLIGTQTWMAENLSYLPFVFPSDQGSEDEPFCYVYGNETITVSTAKQGLNFGSYGVLYNFKQALNICPDGWHLPSDAEWKTLADFLGGDSVSGYKLKSANGWNGKGNGDNSSGFDAVPGGYRNREGGFFLLGENAGFWSSTDTDSVGYAVVRDLGYNYREFGRSGYSKKGGFSVRCLKN